MRSYWKYSKSNYLQAYEKDYWRLEEYCIKKNNGNSKYSTIPYQENSWQSSSKHWPEMDSFSGERNPDQKWPETETYVYSKSSS